VCGPCHGAHDVAPAADRLLGVGGDAACTRCHASGQRAWETAQRLASLRDGALADVRRAGDALRRAREFGVEPAGAAADQRAILAAESRMRSVVHGLDEAAMAEAAQATRVVAQRSERAARSALTRRVGERRHWLYALGPLGALLALLLLKLRGLERRP
jgi:predicted CXXCH cytochrome family protein